MTAHYDELRRLERTIRAAPERERVRHQPALGRMIDAMRAAGESVPASVRELNEDLLSDAIEAQFDNMPV